MWFPKRPFPAREQLYGNQISRGMVEGECIHIGNLIPKTAISSQKAAIRESDLKRYGRRQIYTHRKLWLPKRPFGAEKKLYGNQISRGMVEAECIHNYTLIKFDSRKRPFRARKQLYGNQISRGIVEGKYIHIGNLIPKTALLSQKEALRESNFKRYGRRRMYTHRNLIPKTALLSQKEALYGNQISRGMVEGKYIHIGNLIPKTAISSQKAALRESNFKRYCRRQIYTHRKFWFPKRPFWARKKLCGNQNFKRYGIRTMYTLIGIWFPKRPFRARKQLYGNQISRGIVEGKVYTH